MQVESSIRTAAAAGVFAYATTQQTLVYLAGPPDMCSDTVKCVLKINVLIRGVSAQKSSAVWG